MTKTSNAPRRYSRRSQAYLRGVRLSLTISPQASKLIDELLATGLYGVNGRAGVAQEMIYRGLREMVGPDGLLRILAERRPAISDRKLTAMAKAKR